jgi:hypothetical protein
LEKDAVPDNMKRPLEPVFYWPAVVPDNKLTSHSLFYAALLEGFLDGSNN